MKPVYNGHPWDHAKWLLYRGGLLIEVGGALGLYWLVYRGDLLSQVAVSTVVADPCACQTSLPSTCAWALNSWGQGWTGRTLHLAQHYY